MTKRYIVRDGRSNFRTIREPWQIVDTETNTIVDELHSKRAANGIASDLNAEREMDQMEQSLLGRYVHPVDAGLKEDDWS